MLLGIPNRIEKEITAYCRDLKRLYSLQSISPLLYASLKNYISRPGKRVRPALFVAGYQGYSKKTPSGLYRSALALELFHDFMLVHDDIIDKSETRRGKPAMHSLFNAYLRQYKNLPFDGQDLAIAAGDILYAMAINTFLHVKENMHNKERALAKLTEAGIYTGTGEFIELLYGTKDLASVSKQDIYKVYDLKTANYTFASPLTMGAMLAGAPLREIALLEEYGMNLGRAFQIKDDILGSFGNEAETGKSNSSDIQEKKKTILIWYAYRHTDSAGKKRMRAIFKNKTVGSGDIAAAHKIIRDSGATDYARQEVKLLFKHAEIKLRRTKMRPEYKDALLRFTRTLLAF